MKRLIVMVAGLLLYAATVVYAVDGEPPGNTIPAPPVEPWRQLTYCPIHALEGFAGEPWS